MVEKMVVQGTAVQPGMKLMRIEDHTKMWLDAQVYEEQLPVVKVGQEVMAAVDGVPGKTFKGTITFMYPHVDHMTRTLTVRMTLDNPDFELKPGMYATADIVTRPLDDAIQVPREAVIDTGHAADRVRRRGRGPLRPAEGADGNHGRRRPRADRRGPRARRNGRDQRAVPDGRGEPHHRGDRQAEEGFRRRP